MNCRRVMLIDDDEDDALIFQMAINEVDKGILFSHDNSETAFTLLQIKQLAIPDILFLDWNMPKIDGKQILIELKKTKEYQSTPVVVYTTSTSLLFDVKEIKELGAAHFLTKPNSVSDLVKELKQLLATDWHKK